MTIILVVVVAIFGLFSASQASSAASMANSNIADGGDQFLRIIASKVKINWELTTAIPGARPADDESTVAFTPTDAGDTFTPIRGLTIFYDDVDGDGMFDYDADGGDADGTGIFKLTHSTDKNLEDFSAIVRVWKTTAIYRGFDSVTGQTSTVPVPNSSGVTLNVEISYPADLPIDRRSVRHLTLNVFRPLENPATGYVFHGASAALNINQPPTLGISGRININPNNSGPGGNPEFVLTLPSGVTITRDDLLASGKGGASAEYTGLASSVWIRPKGNGNQNGLTLNNNAFELQNAHGYHIVGQGLQVRLYNDSPNGKAMGKWYIEITGNNAIVTEVF